MSYRALFTADLHMSNKLPYAKPTSDGLTDRFEDQLGLWKRIVKGAKDTGCEAIWILGDLFDQPRADPITLTYVVHMIRTCPLPVYIIPGNHEGVTVKGEYFLVEVFKEIGREDVHVLWRDPLSMPGYTFWPMPYAPIETTSAWLKETSKQLHPETHNVLLLHNSVMGARHLGWACDVGLQPDELEAFDSVLAGHFHNPQVIDHIQYLGAPMHHSFADAGRDAGYWVFEFRNGGIVSNSFGAGAPRFHLLEDLSDDLSEVGIGDYLRYKIRATHADWARIKPKAKAKCDGLIAKGIRADYKQEPVYQHKVRLDPDEKETTILSMDRALGQYVDAMEVDTGKLNPKRLKVLGREMLAEVK